MQDRAQRLLSIQGIGQMTALTRVLEIGEPERFNSIAQAIRYCGLGAAQKESAGCPRNTPLNPLS